MAAILGISALYHDAAAALVVDGQIVAAIQEERLSRRKNDPSLPLRAARACLQLGGLQPGDLDGVVYYENPFLRLERVLLQLVRGFPRTLPVFARALRSQLGDKIWVLDALAEQLGVERARVSHVEHHTSHAASAFLCSPFERAAVLTVDGVGEHTTTAIWLGEGGSLRPLLRQEFPHSLGLLYAALTAYLGLEVNEGEYKVMGLAAFGQPRHREAFASIVRLQSDGSFELDPSYLAGDDDHLAFSPRLERLLGPRRPPRAPWDLSGPDARYADIAATLQQVTEEALLALARRARAETGADALCLAGGVALNAVATGRLRRESGFSRLFVQPAAGDAGCALGAALLGAIERGDPRPSPLRSAALGLPLDVAAAAALAARRGLVVRRLADPAAEAAARLARGEIVALAQGRFEWGPRALGQRSLLAAPFDAAMRERLNRVIKQREPFRPFAPAVLASDASRWFEGVDDDLAPFMTATFARVPRLPRPLDAVVHADGSARLQSVSPGRSPALAAVLTAFARETDAPVVLNTSLNGRGEPICASALDVIAFLEQHPVDAVILDDLLLQRP